MPRGGVEVDASFVEAGAADKSEIVLTIDSVVAMVNGEPVVNDVAPIIKGERTFLPIRLIAEELGATVTWNEADQSVTIVKDDMTIVIYIGQAFALVNGSPVALDEPAFIVNSRTYLPLRFIAENLGAEVIWDGASQTVTVVGKAL
ncbi:MAG: copper amine oxidase N-terminal domain-containing protein [Anaerotignum sp.]|nr:copper amine oxidase N-terminal domain-containing protein [Anaerotignum sp.]